MHGLGAVRRRAARSDAPRARCRSRPPGRSRCAAPCRPGAGGSPTARAAPGSRRVSVDQAVGDHDDRVARAHRVLGLRGERGEARLDRVLAPRHRIGDIELAGPELAAGVALDVADLLHLVEVEHRLDTSRRSGGFELVDAEQVRLRTDERDQRHHQVLADRVDRRVGHLREELLEVVVERLVSCSTGPRAANRCPSSRSAPRRPPSSAAG